MALFGKPNVEKLAANRDYGGLAKALTDKDASLREQAAKALADLHDPASVQPVVERLSGQSDDAVIETGAEALRSMGSEAAPMLAAGLRGAPPAQKPPYAALLGRLGEEHGLAPLLEASRSENPNDRGAAAMGLGLIQSPQATERMIEMFEGDEDMDAKGLAALALASHKAPGAYETFMAALDKPEPLDRALGATGLSILGDERAKGRLEEVAGNDSDERVRERARAALNDLGG